MAQSEEGEHASIGRGLALTSTTIVFRLNKNFTMDYRGNSHGFLVLSMQIYIYISRKETTH